MFTCILWFFYHILQLTVVNADIPQLLFRKGYLLLDKCQLRKMVDELPIELYTSESIKGINLYQIQWFCTLLLYFGTHAYLFLSDKGSCYIFWPKIIVVNFLVSNLWFCFQPYTFFIPKTSFLLTFLIKLMKIWK